MKIYFFLIRENPFFPQTCPEHVEGSVCCAFLVPASPA
jgi:hypothetical protein